MEREIRQRYDTASRWRGALVWISGTLIAAATVAVMAAPGVLDPAFNGTGIVRSSLRGGAHAVAVDHLGRIVVAGWNEPSDGFVIARYNATGSSLDLTFGDLGKVVSQVGGIRYVSDAVVDPAGRIVVTGYTTASGGDADFAIARFNSNGALDMTFNGSGYQIVGFGGEDYPDAILIDAAGRIVVAGAAFTGECLPSPLPCDFEDEVNNDFAILRLTPLGELDASFDGDGKAKTGFGDFEEIRDLAIDALGRIVAVGTIDQTFENARTKQRVAMARYLDDGSLDSSFDGDGKASRTFARDWSEATSVAIDADGGILIGGFRADLRNAVQGFVSYGATADFVLARQNDDGSADVTFGDGGLVAIDFAGWDDLAYAMTIDAAGRVLLAGSSAFGAPEQQDFAIARFSNTGALDPHFGAGGTSRAPFPMLQDAETYDYARGIALDSEGRMVLAGASCALAFAPEHHCFFALARYQTDRPDFTIDAIPNMTVAPGSAESTTITVNSIDGFAVPLQLGLYGTQTGGNLPNGFSSPGVNVTPIPYASVNATLQVSVSAAVAPAQFNLWLIDTDFVDHARRVRVNVVSTAQSTASAVATFTDAGLIHSGVAGALTAKLDAAQAHIDASRTQPAVNTLSAFINQVEAQSGKHIATSATLGGVTFNPAAVLIAQARGVIASLQSEGSAAPLLGYVVDSTQSAVRGATVAILDATNAVVATAVTDATGFYFFSATNAWSIGSTYVARVSGLPSGFTTATPSSQAFTWEGGAGQLESFVLK
jgi:uncharacterized delta-60 repeat protein